MPARPQSPQANKQTGSQKNNLGSDSFNVLSFLQGVGFPLAGTILDGETIGSFVGCLGRVFATANADTVFPHLLGRKPQGYHAIRRNAGVTVYDGSAGGADWTDRTITLRSTGAAIVSFLLF